jgi:DNA polymerase III delta prime subunit
MRMPLVQKYAPRGLSDIQGQDYVKRYFKAIAANPDVAYRNYVITGPWGTGKTSLVRAFANELVGGDATQTPNFIELDSYQVTDRQVLMSLKDYIFQEVPGYKVVLLDEWHLVDPTVQAGLLKDIEGCTLPIFFFFVSTEREGILDTIFSRSLDFTLSKFSSSQMADYARQVLSREGLSISDDTLNAVVFRSGGHMRDLLNQLELVIVVGEESYLADFNTLNLKVQELFTAPSQKVVDELSVYPYTLIQEYVGFFIKERLIREKLLYEPSATMQIFSFYLKLKRFIKNENDFFSFLSLFQDFMSQQRRSRAS